MVDTIRMRGAPSGSVAVPATVMVVLLAPADVMVAKLAPIAGVKELGIAIERKRALPAYPRAVGIVTSTRAAALADLTRQLLRGQLQHHLGPTFGLDDIAAAHRAVEQHDALGEQLAQFGNAARASRDVDRLGHAEAPCNCGRKPSA